MKLRHFPAIILAVLLLALPALGQADTLTSKFSAAVTAIFAKSGTLSTPTDKLSKSIAKEFTNGTGSGQADLIFRDQRTLTTGANEELDLAGGLDDPFGVALTFATVKAILIENLSTTQTLTIGGSASNQFINWVGDATDVIKIPPGGFFALTAPAAGYAVTADTGDLLKVTNSAGASCVYNIIILGTSS
jgi:hypothetical protein